MVISLKIFPNSEIVNAAHIKLLLFMVERAKRVWLSDSLELGFSFFLECLGFDVSYQNH